VHAVAPPPPPDEAPPAQDTGDGTGDGSGDGSADEELVDYDEDPADVAAAEARAAAAAEARIHNPSRSGPAWGRGGLAAHEAAGAAAAAAPGEAAAPAVVSDEAARAALAAFREHARAQPPRPSRDQTPSGFALVSSLAARLAGDGDDPMAVQDGAAGPSAAVALSAEAAAAAAEEEAAAIFFAARRRLGLFVTAETAARVLTSVLDDVGGAHVPTVRAACHYDVPLTVVDHRQRQTYADRVFFDAAYMHLETLTHIPEGDDRAAAVRKVCTLRRSGMAVTIQTTLHNIAVELLFTEGGKFTSNDITFSTPASIEGVDAFVAKLSILPARFHLGADEVLRVVLKHPWVRQHVLPTHRIVACRTAHSALGNAFVLSVVGPQGDFRVGPLPVTMPVSLDVGLDKPAEATFHFYPDGHGHRCGGCEALVPPGQYSITLLHLPGHAWVTRTPVSTMLTVPACEGFEQQVLSDMAHHAAKSAAGDAQARAARAGHAATEAAIAARAAVHHAARAAIHAGRDRARRRRAAARGAAERGAAAAAPGRAGRQLGGRGGRG
jgi:hypothetical protein